MKCVNTTVKNGEEEITVPLVPLHLYYILFEVLKVGFLKVKKKSFQLGKTNWLSLKTQSISFQNAMRATIEHHKGVDPLPEIKVMVILGPENLSIKVREMNL
jgi:hypothetical protein